MMFWVKLAGGVISLMVTIAWVLQIILYILISPPASPLLNSVFIEWVLLVLRCLDDGCMRWAVQSANLKTLNAKYSLLIFSMCRANEIFPLFGTLLFGLFVFYLQAAVIKGNFKFGLNVFFFRVHPMRQGGTIMSSFLFNTALILLATTATIQFAATAFSLYANGTAILNIFGNQLTAIEGLRWIYTKNIFIFIFLVFMLITLAYLLVKGPDAWKRAKPEDVWAS
jgi:LMBR1 domain-containing protein 1